MAKIADARKDELEELATNIVQNTIAEFPEIVEACENPPLKYQEVEWVLYEIRKQLEEWGRDR